MNGRSRQAAGLQANRDEQEPPWWLVLAILTLSGVLLVVYGGTVGSSAIIVVELLIATAAATGGALLGFLFGIPRAPGPVQARDVNQAFASRTPDYSPSNNLEQVSDWLTKILVGVGLVEIKNLSSGLADAGRLVAGSFSPTVGGADLITRIVIVTFTILGFLVSFLWTRVYYGAIQIGADAGIWSLLNGLTSQLQESKAETEEAKAQSQSAVSLASLVASKQLRAHVDVPEAESSHDELPDEILRKIERLKNAKARWDDDPVDDLFPGQPSQTDTRRLEGRVDLELKGALVIVLRVIGSPEHPLVGDAIFLLHPTLPDRIQKTQCKDNAAEIKFYCEGWFHAAAIVDQGKTVLVLDLREIPGVPDWFKKN